MTDNGKSTTAYPRPVQAAAGVGDLAVGQLKKLPEIAMRLRDQVQVELQKISLADVQSRVRSDLSTLPSKVRSEATALGGRVWAEVDQVRTRLSQAGGKRFAEVRTDTDRIRTTVGSTVAGLVGSTQRQVGSAAGQAAKVYEGLATRGAKVLGAEPSGPAASTPAQVPAPVNPGSNPATGQAPAQPPSQAASRPARNTKPTNRSNGSKAKAAR